MRSPAGGSGPASARLPHAGEAGDSSPGRTRCPRLAFPQATARHRNDPSRVERCRRSPEPCRTHTHANDPGPASCLVRGRFLQWWVMDSNQRRTTPMVLQRNTATAVTCGDAPGVGVRSGIGRVASQRRDDPARGHSKTPARRQRPTQPGHITYRDQHEMPRPAREKEGVREPEACADGAPTVRTTHRSESTTTRRLPSSLIGQRKTNSGYPAPASRTAPSTGHRTITSATAPHHPAHGLDR